MKGVDVVEYLELMLSEARDGLSFIDGMSRAEFLTSKIVQHAVTMSLVNIGELSTKIIAEYPEFATKGIEQFKIPLNSMKGMRNRIAHGYFEIDFNVVWETASLSLPSLIQALSGAIKNISQQTDSDALDGGLLIGPKG